MGENIESKLKFGQINLGKRPLANRDLGLRLMKGDYSIILIQEPNIRKGKVSELGKDNIFMFNGTLNGKTIRSAIWVKKEIIKEGRISMLGEFTDTDTTTIDATLKYHDGHQEKIIICSAYLPKLSDRDAKGKAHNINKPLNDLHERLFRYCNNNNLQLIFGCDANAHNQVWSESYNDVRGESIIDTIISHELHILNRGSRATWSNSEHSSIIDITFSTARIKDKIMNWRVIEEETLSDHRLISFEINTEEISQEKSNNIKKCDFIKYKVNVTNFLLSIQNTGHNIASLERTANEFKESLNKAYELSVRTKSKSYSYNQGWYDESLRNKRKNLNKLIKKLNKNKNNHTLRDVINKTYQEKKKEYNTECKKKKREGWKGFTSNLEKTKDIARLQKLLENSNMPKPFALIKPDNNYTRSQTEITELLMETHFPDCNKIRTAERREWDQMQTNEIDIKELESIFNPKTVRWAVNELSPYKAPGKDGIFPVLLQKAGDLAYEIMSQMFVVSALTNYIPTTWRGTIIHFIPKPGKSSYDNPKAYRPISLMFNVIYTQNNGENY